MKKMEKTEKNVHFKKIESYKHNLAINVLSDWLDKKPSLIGINYPISTVKEKEFTIHGRLAFVPDLTVYVDDQIFALFEVCHTHGIDGFKLWEIQKYQYYNNEFFNVYEISAEWIMRQISVPYELQIINKYNDIRLC